MTGFFMNFNTGLKWVKDNNKNTTTTSGDLALVSLLLTLNDVC